MLALTTALSLNAQFRGAWSNDDTPSAGEIHTFKQKGIVGDRLDFAWSAIEPTRGGYNFASTIKPYIKRLSDSGLYIQVEINVGKDAPTGWLHSADGVDTFYTTGNGAGNAGPYPDAYNANYVTRYLLLHDTLRKFFNTLTTNEKKYFKAFMVKNGSTGDYFFYKGDAINSNHGIIDDETWATYTRRMFDSVSSYYVSNTFLNLAFNSGVDFRFTREYRQWYPGCWLKYGNPTHGYAIDGNAWIADSLKTDTAVIFGEIQQPMSNSIYGRKDWLALLQSDLSLDGQIANFSASMIADDSCAMLAAWFNKYADQQQPATASKGFCQLADLVNIDSTARWSEGTYGDLITNTVGYNAAVAAINASVGSGIYKKFQILNRTKSYTNTSRVTSLTASNGIGAVYNEDTSYKHDFIYSGVDNYSLHIKQKAANSTSYGVYRYGPNASAYGRNGRKFTIDGAGRGAMFFDISDALKRTGTGDSMRISVTYLDEGTGRWGLYCFRCRAFKLAQVQNTNSGEIKTAVFIAPKFRWGNKLANGSDIQIKLLDGDNFTISTIEVERLN